eukprot:PhF_6_TR36723/c0_g1_i1/m.54080
MDSSMTLLLSHLQKKNELTKNVTSVRDEDAKQFYVVFQSQEVSSPEGWSEIILTHDSLCLQKPASSGGGSLCSLTVAWEGITYIVCPVDSLTSVIRTPTGVTFLTFPSFVVMHKFASALRSIHKTEVRATLPVEAPKARVVSTVEDVVIFDESSTMVEDNAAKYEAFRNWLGALSDYTDRFVKLRITSPGDVSQHSTASLEQIMDDVGMVRSSHRVLFRMKMRLANIYEEKAMLASGRIDD